jgi:two-component system cell cycle response regulator
MGGNFMRSSGKSTILIVDDNVHNLQVLAVIVEKLGCDSVLAMDGQQALEYVEIERPDLILLDVMMPRMDGYEICSLFKKNSQLKDIPVIFLTAKSEIEDIVKGFEVGGVDYVIKPFNAIELKARIKTHLSLKKSNDEIRSANEELREANNIIEKKNSQLKEMMEQLELAAKTDMLTGLYNRRHMMAKIEEEVSKFKRHKRSFSFIMADIDFFKKVNDIYGHNGGDYVLKVVANILSTSIRAVDTVARWGGEEFLIMLPEVEVEGAGISAERIRKNVAERLLHYQGVDFTVTITLGVATFTMNDEIDEAIKRADDALYAGKARGRNCVSFA